jgi:glycerophosphoryl diester phosphodiesterase
MKPPLIIAHRGASRDAPENTLAAFRLAWVQRADGIEGDFRITRDGRLVACHDPTTRRTGGHPLVVASSTLASLKTVDIGRWKARRWAGERIPTVDEVLDELPPGRLFYVELYEPAAVALLRRALRRSRAEAEAVRVISFDPATVRAATHGPHPLRALWILARRRAGWHCTPSGAEVAGMLRRLHAEGVDVRVTPGLDAPFARAVLEAGFSLHVWTVNHARAAARCVRLGASSLTTDRPGALRAALGVPPAS